MRVFVCCLAVGEKSPPLISCSISAAVELCMNDGTRSKKGDEEVA